MSVVAVKRYADKIVIGADSIRITYDSQEKDKKAKLVRISPQLVLGSVGDCAVSGLFQEYLKNHLPKTNDEYGYTSLLAEFQRYLRDLDDRLRIDESEFLIVYKARAFLLSNYFIREIRDYYAIGAGMDFANAALHLGCDIKKAIKTACELSIYCEAPVNTITIPLK